MDAYPRPTDLLAEDDPTISAFTRAAFGRAGDRVVCAHNQRVIARLREFFARTFSSGLVV